MAPDRIDPLQDPRWRRFTQQHPLASIFHSCAWLEALKRTYGYQPGAFIASAGDSIESGLVFCDISSWITGSRLVSLPFSDHCEVLVTSPEQTFPLWSALVEHSRETGAKYAEIRPIERSPLRNTGFHETQQFFLHNLDLRPSLPDLFRSFHKDSIQRKIQRAGRDRLRLEEGRDEALLESFYRLLLVTRRHHSVPPPPRNWFANLIHCFGHQLTIRVAYKETTAIAAILTLSYGDTLVYKYGGSEPRFHALGGIQALFWQGIQEAKDQGLQRFDLGRTEADNQGLVTFKDRWGTTRVTINYFRYAFKASMIARPTWGVPIARLIFSHMPTKVLSAAGKLLYRHVG
jgi:lipid II:glycine glycyltransferase (peptidoglycan interpeptide bridge formation enzyme)